jgi:hypothetical protein
VILFHGKKAQQTWLTVVLKVKKQRLFSKKCRELLEISYRIHDWNGSVTVATYSFFSTLT